MTDYLERVNQHIIDTSNKARKHRDGKAWDNAKRKARKRYVPRGKVFAKLTREEHQRWWKEITADLPEDMVGKISRKNPADYPEENYDDGVTADEESHYD